jgi:pre-mRNA cleavage complex 2 protein Pcf11
MSLHGYTATGAPVGYVQSSASYQYPQPSHTSLYDPNAFRQFYMAQLTALTFNSRHIIQNLSMIAQEYVRMSDIVVQCIEMHIRRVSVFASIQRVSFVFRPQWRSNKQLCEVEQGDGISTSI